VWVLEDLVQEESYLEIRAVTNQQPNTVFAIRLATAHAGQWLTNLPVVLEPLTGARAVINPDQTGWSLKTATGFIELSRVGDWTLVAAAGGQSAVR